MIVRAWLCGVLAATFALAGCSGSGSGAHAVSVPRNQAKTVQVQLSIVIPLAKKTSGARVARFVSPGTRSGGIAIGAALVQNITQSFDLSPSAPGCTVSGSARTCQVTVDLPLGSDTVTLFTYDGLLSGGKPSGNQLATATVTQTIVEGAANTVTISLMGIPASATIVPAQPSLVSTGSASTVALTVTVYDASGNQITGSDPFAQPVVLNAQPLSLFGSGLRVSVNGGNGAFTKPTDTAVLSYAGRDGTGAYTISATINSGNTLLGTASFSVQPGFRRVQLISGSLANADLVQRYDNRDVWLTEPAAHKLASYTTAGGFTEYPLASGNEPRHIVFSGSSGNPQTNTLPFVISELQDKLGVVHADASVSEYALPTANAGLGGILFDPVSFTVWFAERNAGKIGRANLSGAITELPTGIAGSAPASVAVNNLSGGIWFTDPGTNAIGQMKKDGTFVEFPVPTANAAPAQIVSQTTNDTWFTESNAPNLGHIDNASGTIIEYPAGDVIVSVVPAASDGFTSLWVVLRNGTVEYFDGRSTRFTVVPNNLPAGGTAVAAAIGLSNDVWVLRSSSAGSELDELLY